MNGGAMQFMKLDDKAALIYYNVRRNKEAMGKNKMLLRDWLRRIVSESHNGCTNKGIAKPLSYKLEFQSFKISGFCRKGYSSLYFENYSF